MDKSLSVGSPDIPKRNQSFTKSVPLAKVSLRDDDNTSTTHSSSNQSLPPIERGGMTSPVRPSSSSNRNNALSPRKSKESNTLSEAKSNSMFDNSKISLEIDASTQRDVRKILNSIHHSIATVNKVQSKDISREIENLPFPEVLKQLCIQYEVLQSSNIKKRHDEIESLTSKTSTHFTTSPLSTMDSSPRKVNSEPKSEGFEVDDLIQGRFCGGPFYYPGFISATTINDKDEKVYEVTYDDGEVETNVNLNMLIRFTSFSVGASVRARENRGPHYTPCTITKIDESGTKFDLRYENGNIEIGVEINRIKHLNKEAIKSKIEESVRRRSSVTSSPIPQFTNFEESKINSNNEETIELGTLVKTGFRGGSIQSNARVFRVNDDDSYAIAFDDGCKEYAVPKSRLRFIRHGTVDEINEIKKTFSNKRMSNVTNTIVTPRDPIIEGKYEEDAITESKYDEDSNKSKSSKDQEKNNYFVKYDINEKVRAKHRDNDSSFSLGTIYSINSDVTYGIIFEESGIKEESVTVDRIEKFVKISREESKIIDV